MMSPSTVDSGVGPSLIVDAAAEALRRVHDDPAGAMALGGRARDHMERTRNPVLVGKWLAAHAERLRRSQLVPA